MELLSREVVMYLGVIINDYQFDKNSDDYLGFINIDPSNSGEYTFVALELAKNYKHYELILESVGMKFASIPNVYEMIITEINRD
jgi:hypothetical protein